MRYFLPIAVFGLLALVTVEAAIATSQRWANQTVQRVPHAQGTPDPTKSESNSNQHTVLTGQKSKNDRTQEVSNSQTNTISGIGESRPINDHTTSALTEEWTWGTDFIPWTKPPCPITRKCSEVCESWESCTSNRKIITNYTENISTMTSHIYVLEPWTEELVVTSTGSWVGPGASYFIDDLAPPRRVECPVDDLKSGATTCSQTVTMTMLIWTIDVGEITYHWETVISYHPTTSCPSRGFTITRTSTQTSTYTETTFESYYTTLTKWITLFENAIHTLPPILETTTPTVGGDAARLTSAIKPIASSTQHKPNRHVLQEERSSHLQRRQMGIGLPTLGFDDDISSGWEEESDTRTCGPYYTTFTIDFHTVVTVLTSSVPIVVTTEEYTTKIAEQSFGTLAKPPVITKSTKGTDPTHIQGVDTPIPTRIVPAPTGRPSGEERPLPWPLRVTTAPTGVGLILPDGRNIPIGSVTEFSGFRVSVPVPSGGLPLTAVHINGELFALPSSKNSGKESIQIKSFPVPVARLGELLGKARPVLLFADGRVLEPGGTIMFSNHKITFSEDASAIEVDGQPIAISLPVLRDGVVVGAIVMLPDGSHVVVTSKPEFESDSQLWSSILEISSRKSSITVISTPLELVITTAKGDDSATEPDPSSVYRPSGERLASTSLRGTASTGEFPFWGLLLSIIGWLL